MTIIKAATDTTTPYAVGEKVDGDVDIDVEVGVATVKPTPTPTPAVNPIDLSGPKQGHMFCGACCDVRRATIAINIVSIVFDVINVISFSVAVGNVNYVGTNDTYYKDKLNAALTGTIIASIIGVCFSIAAISGAIKFNIWLIGSNIVWLVIGFITTIAVSVSASAGSSGYSYGALNILFGLAFLGFFLYPHIMLVYEIKVSKTMSQETYTPREEKSCCCVSPRQMM